MRKKPITGWAGFMDGELDLSIVDCGWGGYGTGDTAKMPMIFRTRAIASKKYEDVRKVEIHEVRRKQ